MSVTILAIESSCDETSCAVMSDGVLLSNVIAGQEVHQQYGGVIPELASRAHQLNIVPVVDLALKQAGIERTDLSAISFTEGPGLIGALLVGSSFAKGLALALNIPLIAVNHMQAHVLAHFIDEPKPSFPFLCLTVSGGHTQIVLVKDYLKMEVIGETNDDAAGEAFDKTAKLLGLQYPGGPMIDSLAKTGNPNRFKFPEPKVGAYDFSFSGLKTSILYFLRSETKKNENFVNENLNDICASVQSRIVSILLTKLEKAAVEFAIKDIGIAGGVSANSFFRNQFEELGEKNNWRAFIPKFEFCTDNAAMIAMVGHYKFNKSEFENQTVIPKARLSINETF